MNIEKIYETAKEYTFNFLQKTQIPTSTQQRDQLIEAFEQALDSSSKMNSLEFNKWVTDNFSRTYPTESVVPNSKGKVLFSLVGINSLKLENGIYEDKELYKYWIDNVYIPKS